MDCTQKYWGKSEYISFKILHFNLPVSELNSKFKYREADIINNDNKSTL